MHSFLQELGIQKVNSGACGNEWIKAPKGKELISRNPSTGEPIATIIQASNEDYDSVMNDAVAAFEKWRTWPAPKRGEVIRQLGDALRQKKAALASLVSLEMGKIKAEGFGEVQEMIDICDFSVGLSRQLYGNSMHSERPGHRMYEQWHPLGVVGIISAFNFPTAVWSWNSAIAAVCGDSMIWKPSSDTPLCAIAVQNIAHEVLARHDIKGLMGLVIGKGSEVGERLLHDPRIPLISATGSCLLGERVMKAGAPRFARTILELGGNNAIIVLDDADLDLAARAILFGAVGTAGQRCTTTRRLIMQRGIAAQLTERLRKAYTQIRIGDPLEDATLMGPLINEDGVTDMMHALGIIKQQGGEIISGGKRLDRPGYFVEPTLVKFATQAPIVKEETFAPILYLMECADVEEAIHIQNDVTQGLSSSIFTRNLLAAETFLSARGSDCGIANVNIGTSGAEIGGAFGGEKATGGGREAGSDSWKQYMRRQTNTINWSTSLPLAQGIQFG
jgi:aldehyde dehydrogenase (NAD+)